MARILSDATAIIVEMLSLLRDMAHARSLLQKRQFGNAKERQADDTTYSATTMLFEAENHPVDIKWKNTYEDIEEAFPSCMGGANVVDAIVI